MRRSGREGWILAVLLGVFVVTAVYYGERGFQSQQSDQPTTYSVGPGGLKALYQLYERQGFRVGRLEGPYTRLPGNAGLLVVVEPLERDVADEEKEALQKWVERGGSVLAVVSAPWRTSGNKGVALDDVRVEDAASKPADVQPDAEDTFLDDVKTVHLAAGKTRLKDTGAKGDNQTLVTDPAGASLVYWTYDKGGTVVALADDLAPTNGALAAADNAILYVNIARDLTKGRPLVLFDEYHQGFGSETTGARSLWQALGAPVRAAFWYAVIVFLLVLYNLNRRFGAARALLPPESRPSTDYISSMAGLFRRAGAPELAVETIYKAFIRDLAVRVDAPPDATADSIGALAVQHLGWDAAAVRDVVNQCERVVAGERLSEGEAVRVARQMRLWRHDAQLDRLAAAQAGGG